ncbi:MAG: hypothetical protein EB053_02595 [Chlamydiae bacterium]|nr:hypothetical protein [Chlamydiota bacterium]
MSIVLQFESLRNQILLILSKTCRLQSLCYLSYIQKRSIFQRSPLSPILKIALKSGEYFIKKSCCKVNFLVKWEFFLLKNRTTARILNAYHETFFIFLSILISELICLNFF